jgi:GNAT superfamily N-acetyltransferase
MRPMEADTAFSDLDILLTDGSAAHVRDIRSSDADLLREFHESLSARSIAFRYLGPHPALSDKEVARFTNVDRIDRVALVVERDGRIVAVARYDRPPESEEAEVAFVVQDEFQGLGLGTILLDQLAIIARRHGIRRFLADTFSENRRMLGVFRDSGFPRRYSRESGVVQVVLDIVSNSEAAAAPEEVVLPVNILGPPTLPSEGRMRQP